MDALYLLLFISPLLTYGLFNESSRIIKCTPSCTDNSCHDACNELSRVFDTYRRLEEDADANVRFHCTGMNVMMIKHNPGYYIIEQSTSERTWGPPWFINGSCTTLTNLTADTHYRYRLHRLTKDGITRPEISNWFSTYKANYRPLAVKNIFVSKPEVDENNMHELRAEITFEPAEDRSCRYNILVWHGEHRLDQYERENKPDFRFELKHLDYGQNTTVIMSSSNDNGTKVSKSKAINFITPSCHEFHSNLSICAPKKVEGLRVEHIYSHGTFYNVLISWDKPTHEPVNYIVQLDFLEEDEHSIRISVPGNMTEASFCDVELTSQYEVSVIAESLGGTSQEEWIQKTVFKERTNNYNIIIGSIAFITVIILTTLICLQCYKQKNKHFSMDYTNFECLNQHVKADTKMIEKDYAVENKEIPLTPDKFELCPELLKLKHVLGCGAYGIVRLGTLRDEFGNVSEVAVKTLKDNPSSEDVRNFQQEILMMKFAGQHPNIVSLIGCCTLYNKPLLVVEYCCKGDLQSYLRMIWQNMVNVAFDRRTRLKFDTESFIDSGIERLSNTSGGIEPNYQNVRMITNRLYDIQQDVEQSVESVTAADLLNFARQVAKGMEFLACNRIVHRDLAARNVLVCADRVVKISDFGLSRDIYQENLYRKQGNGKLPLKWMAIEALTHQIYTTQSDVWSFGILLWEIVTMGALPYPGIPTDRILKLLKSGYRMERPSNCGLELYNIMLSCWNTCPQSRPTFTGLKDSLDKLLSSFCENKYLNITEVLDNSEELYVATSEN